VSSVTSNSWFDTLAKRSDRFPIKADNIHEASKLDPCYRLRLALNALILLGWLAGAVLAAHAITSSGTVGFVLAVGFLVGSLAAAVRVSSLTHRCAQYERLLRKHDIDPRSGL
jgi:hypothetical protein